MALAAVLVAVQAARLGQEAIEMNENQVKGGAKDIAGKVQEKVGEVTGNKTQEAKGDAKQVEGQVQRKTGDVQEAVKDVTRKP